MNYNADGEFFVQVLGNEDFTAWIEQEFGETGLLRVMGISEGAVRQMMKRLKITRPPE